MYPEIHFLYKPNVFKGLRRLFEYEGDGTNRENYYAIIQRIRDVVNDDNELKKMSQARLGADCYQDPKFSLLATDIAYFAFKLQEKKDEAQKLAAKPAIVADFKNGLRRRHEIMGNPTIIKPSKYILGRSKTRLINSHLHMTAISTCSHTTPTRVSSPSKIESDK
jgi:hypothetical protein